MPDTPYEDVQIEGHLIDSLMISAPVAYFLSLLMLGGGP